MTRKWRVKSKQPSKFIRASAVFLISLCWLPQIANRSWHTADMRRKWRVKSPYPGHWQRSTDQRRILWSQPSYKLIADKTIPASLFAHRFTFERVRSNVYPVPKIRRCHGDNPLNSESEVIPYTVLPRGRKILCGAGKIWCRSFGRFIKKGPKWGRTFLYL
jgi:hypothetical protein